MAALEQEQAKLQTTLADGKLYVQDSTLAAQHAQRINAIDEELLHCLERAEALGA